MNEETIRPKDHLDYGQFEEDEPHLHIVQPREVPKNFWRWVLGTTAVTLFCLSGAILLMAAAVNSGSTELKLAKIELMAIKQELQETKKALMEANFKLLTHLEAQNKLLLENKK